MYREQAHAVEDTLELVLGVEEADAEAYGIERHDGPGDDRRPVGQFIQPGLGRPAPDPERDERAHLMTRRQQLDTVDLRELIRSSTCEASAASMDIVETDVHREPADRPGETGDRWSMKARALEASGVAMPGGAAAGIGRLEREVTRKGGPQPVEGGGVNPEGAHAVGSEEPFLGRDGVGIHAQSSHRDRDRTGSLRAVDDDDGTAIMGKLGDPGHRQDRPGRPQHVGDRDEARSGHDGTIQGRNRDIVIRSVADLREPDFDPDPIAQRVERTHPTGVFVGGGDGHVTRLPVQCPDRVVHPVGGRMREAHRIEARPEDRGDPGPRLVHPVEPLEVVVELAASDGPLVVCELRHHRGDLGRHGADASGIHLDRCRQRRQSDAHRRQLVRVGHEWGDHGRMIPAMPHRTGTGERRST